MHLKNRPNIILIVLDALRADHVSCYGYHRNTTPSIDRIAEQGVLFKQTISPGIWTLPSHASIFTGLYTTEHGAIAAHMYLNRDIPVLPEILSMSGYRTIGFSANPWVGKQTGLSRGFDAFFEFNWGMSRGLKGRIGNQIGKIQMLEFIPVLGFKHWWRSAILAEAIRWLTFLSHENNRQPFFMFFNFIEPHLPHRPSPKFRNMFLSDRVSKEDLVKINNKLGVFQDQRLSHIFNVGCVDMAEHDWQILLSLYDAEIAAVDSKLQILFSCLERLKILDNTALIITSDHGDNYGEHNLMGHQLCVYDTLIRVPLIIRYPARLPKGELFYPPVQTLDLFTTILDLAGVSTAEYPIRSKRRSLLTRMSERDSDCQDGFAYSEMDKPILAIEIMKKIRADFDKERFDAALRCIRTDRYKYIWSERGQDEFYDLTTDPEERNNIADRDYPEMLVLKSSLENWFRSLERPKSFDKEDAEMDEDVRKRLRSLGYIE